MEKSKKVQKCAEKMDRVDRGADECRKSEERGSQGSYEMWKCDWPKLHTCGGVWDKYCLTQSWRARGCLRKCTGASLREQP